MAVDEELVGPVKQSLSKEQRQKARIRKEKSEARGRRAEPTLSEDS
jgi:hypothetical protein